MDKTVHVTIDADIDVPPTATAKSMDAAIRLCLFRSYSYLRWQLQSIKVKIDDKQKG